MKQDKPVAMIYCIRNKINGFVYIGVTSVSIEKRFKDHMRKKSHWIQSSKKNLFTNDIEKYGAENFTIELVENIYDPKVISEIENYWMGKFDKNKMYNRNKSAYTADVYNRRGLDRNTIVVTDNEFVYQHNPGKGKQ